jgi:hypothetical protein
MPCNLDFLIKKYDKSLKNIIKKQHKTKKIQE